MANMVASQIHVISAHKGDITDVAFTSSSSSSGSGNSGSNSTSILATVSGDKTVRLWSAQQQRQQGGGDDDDGAFKELPHSPLLGHTYIIHCCTFSPSGDVLATCSTDGKLILWHTRSGDVKVQFQHPSKCGIRVCRFSPDSSRIATGSDDDSICVWDIASETLVRSFTGLEDSVVCLAYSPDGHFLLSGSPNGDLYTWDAQFGHGRYLSLKVDAHDLGVTCCQFSPTFGTARNMDSAVVRLLLATGGKDHLIKLWTFAAQVGSAEVLLKCHASLPGHTDLVMACEFSPSGEILASGSFDKTVRLWDPLKGIALFSIDACHNRFVTCLAFSADGRLLATGSMDRTVKLWTMTDTSRIMHGLSGYEEPQAQQETTTAPAAAEGHPMAGFTVEDVADWLSLLGLPQHAPAFSANAIDGPELLALTEADLQGHLGVVALGHRNKIIRSRDLGGLIPAENAPHPEEEMEEVRAVASQGDRVAWRFPGSSGTGERTALRPTVPTQHTVSSSLPSAPQLERRTRPSAQWSVDEVGVWLVGLGLEEYGGVFRAQAIDGRELLALSDQDLSSTLGITALGHRNKILRSRDEQTKTTANQKTPVIASTSKGTVRDHEEFVCPISMVVMRDPVIAADGYTYDRQAISAWLEKGKGRSPMTNAPLPHTSLTPNRTLKMMIQRHLEQASR